MRSDRSWKNPSGRFCTRSTDIGKAMKTRFMASSSPVLPPCAGLGAGGGSGFLTTRACLPPLQGHLPLLRSDAGRGRP